MLIRPYTPQDGPGISRFMEQNFMNELAYATRSFDAAYYRWKYAENWAGKPVVRVAEDEGEIVGLMCAVPRKLWVNGEVYSGAESGDTFIHPEYRGKHLFLEMARSVFEACREAGMAFVCGVPNPVSLPVMTRIFRYDVLFEYRSVVRPLRIPSVLRKKTGSKILAGALGVPASWIHALLFSIPFPRGRMVFERMTVLDDRLDALWERNKKEYTFSFVKNREYLDWRFVKNPEAFEIHLIHDGSEPVGYVVIKFADVMGYRFALIADLMIPRGDARLYGRCLRNLEIWCRNREADFLAHWAMLESREFRIHRRMGFFVRKKKYWFILRDEIGLLSRLSDRKNRRSWTFSQADSDNI